MAKLLANYQPTPVDNPLEALREVAGRIVAWSKVAEERLAELDTIETYSDATGEQVRAAVLIFERALDAARHVLVDMARLNLDERIVALNERVARAVADWVRGVFEDPDFAITAEQKAAYPKLLRRHLELARGNGSESA